MRLWNPYVPAKPTASLRGHSTAVLHIAFNDLKNHLLSFSKDKVRLRHASTCSGGHVLLCNDIKSGGGFKSVFFSDFTDTIGFVILVCLTILCLCYPPSCTPPLRSCECGTYRTRPASRSVITSPSWDHRPRMPSFAILQTPCCYWQPVDLASWNPVTGVNSSPRGKPSVTQSLCAVLSTTPTSIRSLVVHVKGCMSLTVHVRWCMSLAVHVKGCMSGGACQAVHVRRCMSGGACQGVHVRWCMSGGACQAVHVRQCMSGGACQAVHVRWCMSGGACQTVHVTGSACQAVHVRWCMSGGACQAVHVRWCMSGGACQVVHVRWCMSGGACQAVHVTGSACQTVHVTGSACHWQCT